MSSSPLISVVIPTYNSRRLLESAVASVEGQTFRDFEIIVVDDGSTDDTRDWIERYRHRLRYIRQENQGAGAARNQGAKAAAGKYIAFLDADDIWLPDKLERQLAVIAAEPFVKLVCSDGYWFSGLGTYPEVLRDLSVRLSDRYCRNPFYIDFDQEFKMHRIPTSSLLVDRAAFLAVGGFPGLKYCEDVVLCCLVMLHGSARCVQEPLMAYRSHDGNTSSRVKSARESWQRILFKDKARMAVIEAAGSRSARRIMRVYGSLPLPMRLMLLLAWRIRYAADMGKVVRDLMRYARVYR